MRKWVLLLCFCLLGLGMLVARSRQDDQAASGFVPAQAISPHGPVELVTPVPHDAVLLEVTVNPQGEVEDVQVLHDYPGATEDALRAIQRWKFRPAMIDGKPIRSSIPVLIQRG